MNFSNLFSMRNEDTAIDVGVVYSPSVETLRRFGASYMQDANTTGTLAIFDPQGRSIFAFDIWQGRWTETAETDT